MQVFAVYSFGLVFSRCEKGRRSHCGEAPVNQATEDLTEAALPEPRLDYVVGEQSVGSLLVPERLSVWAWVLGYTAILSSLSVLRYHLWLATGYDLGMFEQGLWLILHHGLHAVSTFTGQPILADAGAYILVPLAPFYAVGGLGFLLVLQAFCFGLGYYFIRGIGASLQVDPRRAHLLGVVYLIFPTVLGANLFDFHPDALGIPILFALIWAAIERRWGLYLLAALGALLVKDTVPLLLFGLSITLTVRREIFWGLLTLAVSFVAAYIDLKVLLPNFAPAGMAQWPALYGYLGASPSAGVSHLVQHPTLFFNWLHRERAWAYLVWLLGPFIGALWASRTRLLNAWWLPALALLDANLLAAGNVMTSPFNEMSVLAVPFLSVGVLSGVARPTIAWRPRETAIWMVVPILLLAVFVEHQYRTNWHTMPSNSQQLVTAIHQIPPGVPLVAQNQVIAHLADRTHEWTPNRAVSRRLPAGTYLLLDRQLPPTTPNNYAATIEKATQRKGHGRVVYAESGVILYKLTAPLQPLEIGRP